MRQLYSPEQGLVDSYSSDDRRRYDGEADDYECDKAKHFSRKCRWRVQKQHSSKKSRWKEHSHASEWFETSRDLWNIGDVTNRVVFFSEKIQDTFRSRNCLYYAEKSYAWNSR